jgi:SulP family sulfate permease
MHSLYLLAFMLVAAPLAGYIPLAALGAVLAVVAWNMAEKEEFAALLRASAGDATVLLATFLLTIFVDLTTAIAVGVTLGAFLFLKRLADAVEIESGSPLISEDRADQAGAARSAYEPGALGGDVIVYRISGAFFFGASAAVSSVLDRIGEHPKTFVLDFAEVPLVDSTAAKTLKDFVHRLDRAGTRVYFSGASKAVRRTLLAAGLGRPLVRYAATADDALAQAQGASHPS